MRGIAHLKSRWKMPKCWNDVESPHHFNIFFWECRPSMSPKDELINRYFHFLAQGNFWVNYIIASWLFTFNCTHTSYISSKPFLFVPHILLPLNIHWCRINSGNMCQNRTKVTILIEWMNPHIICQFNDYRELYSCTKWRLSKSFSTHLSSHDVLITGFYALQLEAIQSILKAICWYNGQQVMYLLL